MPAIALKRHEERNRKLKLLPHPGYALVLTEIAKGRSVKGSCARLRRRGAHVPTPQRVFGWALQSPERYELFTRAIEAKTEAQMDTLEELLEGAFIDEETGKRIDDPAMLAVRLRAAEATVKLRQWRASKAMPKKWGDKLQHEHSGSLSVVVATGVDAIPLASPTSRIGYSLGAETASMLDDATDAVVAPVAQVRSVADSFAALD